MKKVFISGPYSAPTPGLVADNIITAAEIARLWWAAGAAVFCPHTNSAHMEDICPHENFLAADLLFFWPSAT